MVSSAAEMAAGATPTHPPVTRRSVLAGLGLALLPAVAGCSREPLGSTPTPAPTPTFKATCSNPSPPPADPPRLGVWFGAALDWAKDSIPDYTARLGHAPAVASVFDTVPFSNLALVDRVAEQAQRAHSMLLLTLEPRQGLQAVTTSVADNVAHEINTYNRAGVPVMVRFAHDMNGSWFPWSQDPVGFLSAFRRLADAVHLHAAGSAMMWAPHYGGGYPFGNPSVDPQPPDNDGGPVKVTGARYLARPGTEAFRLLDTDGDGMLTYRDDPYGPYWPGKDAADWVGMSLYHWGTVAPWNRNVLPTPNKFVRQLRGTYSTPNEPAINRDFYGIYGEQMQCPVAIPETAALYIRGQPGPTELEVKQAWWRQLFADSTHQQLPWVRMINWFEFPARYELEAKAEVNWSSTYTAEIRDAFRADLPTWARFAGDVPQCTS